VVELDILRAVAIIIIIFGHSKFFLPTLLFSTAVYGYITASGIALFFFISGFVLYLNHPRFPKGNGLADFYKKRLLRIFPLLWLSLAFRVVIGQLQFASQLDAPILVLGLQGLLSPRFGTNSIMSDWGFIGAIVVLYTIYPLIAVLASDALKLPAPLDSDVVKFALMLIVPLLILAVAHAALSIIADGVFEFYGIFVIGVAISKYEVLSKYGFLTDNRAKLLKKVAVATVFLTAVLVLSALLWQSANVSALSFFASYGLVNVLYLVFALLTFCLARIMVISISNASRPLSYAVYRALLVIAFSSYAIFLFFMPILRLSYNALIGAQLTALEIDLVQIFVVLPMVVAIAYLLQSTQNEILKKVRTYRTAPAPPPDST
jgi:peptidoglycan/LPS O-acetylase OafA/YrhL